MRRAALLVVVLALAASAAAEGRSKPGSEGSPQGKPDWGAMRQACMEDARRLCPGSETPGMCLDEKRENLSPDCRRYKERMRKARKGHGGWKGEPGEKPHKKRRGAEPSN